MKIEKRIDVPATSRVVVDHYSCDLCGTHISPHQHDYDIEEITVSLKTGNSYPGTGDSVETIFDICKKCFTQKLIPWFATQDAKPRTEEVDW